MTTDRAPVLIGRGLHMCFGPTEALRGAQSQTASNDNYVRRSVDCAAPGDLG